MICISYIPQNGLKDYDNGILKEKWQSDKNTPLEFEMEETRNFF